MPWARLEAAALVRREPAGNSDADEHSPIDAGTGWGNSVDRVRPDGPHLRIGSFCRPDEGGP
jgi:hypothetical protein